jgi:hypothetical protein
MGDFEFYEKDCKLFYCFSKLLTLYDLKPYSSGGPVKVLAVGLYIKTF